MRNTPHVVCTCKWGNNGEPTASECISELPLALWTVASRVTTDVGPNAQVAVVVTDVSGEPEGGLFW